MRDCNNRICNIWVQSSSCHCWSLKMKSIWGMLTTWCTYETSKTIDLVFDDSIGLSGSGMSTRSTGCSLCLVTQSKSSMVASPCCWTMEGCCLLGVSHQGWSIMWAQGLPYCISMPYWIMPWMVLRKKNIKGEGGEGSWKSDAGRAFEKFGMFQGRRHSWNWHSYHQNGFL